MVLNISEEAGQQIHGPLPPLWAAAAHRRCEHPQRQTATGIRGREVKYI